MSNLNVFKYLTCIKVLIHYCAATVTDCYRPTESKLETIESGTILNTSRMCEKEYDFLSLCLLQNLLFNDENGFTPMFSEFNMCQFSLENV